ncbi:MAG: FGGY family carbohydrate kinase [Deltaproteobacteria bacterium]|nr:FGGY family carbohydrate kinase [Deltaproteobacteria bacterium]
MKRELLLALDLGTTSVRALVMNGTGGTLARAQRPLSINYPRPGWVEQDPEEMWERSVDVMREVLSAAEVEARTLAGIGVVTQRATAVAWDARTGAPLAPAVSWQDLRTSERVEGFRKLGIPLSTLASATKFEWLLEHDPAVRKAASTGGLRLGTPESWLTSKLTGGSAHVTDPGNASCTALYNVANGHWADPLLKLFSVPAEVLPEIVATSGVVGETPAALLGAPVPVAARAGDQQAAAFAQGVHAAGQAKLTLGTSAMLDLHTGSELAEPGLGVYPLVLWRLADGTQACCLEGTVITAGAAVDWLVGLGLASDAEAVNRLASEVPTSEGVTFVPSLQGLGTPFLDAGATGLLGGMTRGTGVAQIARAVLEGVAQRCVDVCEALGLDDVAIRVDGGLARSEVLLQSLADLGGREVQRAAETEATAVGAAQLAGLATGVFASPEACQSTVASTTSFAPVWDPARRAHARERWGQVLARARSG